MRRLFGMGKEEEKKAPAGPSLQEASAKLDLQVQNLEAKIVKADEEIRTLVAKGTSNPTAKQRAMQAMKKKKMYEQQRDQLLGTQFNVENLAFQQEQAEVTLTAVEAMKAGQEQLKAQQQKINIGQVDKLTDDLAELQDEMKAINEALATSSSLGVEGTDEADLEEEYAKMEEEMAAMTLAGASAEPAASSAAGSSGEAAALEQEYARLAAAATAAPSAPLPAGQVPSAPPA